MTFLRQLEGHRLSDSRRAIWIFQPAAHIIFEQAKRRVYLLDQPFGKGDATDQKQQQPPGKRRRKGGREGGDSPSGQRSPAEEAPEAAAAAAEGREVELTPVLEELPKWQVTRDLLEEIQRERAVRQAEQAERRAAHKEAGPSPDPLRVLVVCKDQGACHQLREACRPGGGGAVMRGIFDRYLLSHLGAKAAKGQQRKARLGRTRCCACWIDALR